MTSGLTPRCSPNNRCRNAAIRRSMSRSPAASTRRDAIGHGPRGQILRLDVDMAPRSGKGSHHTALRFHARPVDPHIQASCGRSPPGHRGDPAPRTAARDRRRDGAFVRPVLSSSHQPSASSFSRYPACHAETGRKVQAQYPCIMCRTCRRWPPFDDGRPPSRMRTTFQDELSVARHPVRLTAAR